MDKNTGIEEFGPSQYDYDFDFDVDLRLSTIDYFLMVPYVLVIFPVAWISELVMSKIQGHRSRKRLEEGDVTSPLEFQHGASVGSYCSWPRHSHG